MLSIDSLKSAYGRIEVLHGVTLNVAAGEIVTLIGANGAGKTTLLHAISGVQPIIGGAIEFDGQPIEQMPAHRRVSLGISQVPEGRQLFEPLSVKDNLKLGAWSRVDDPEADLARIRAMFPILEAMWEKPAGAGPGPVPIGRGKSSVEIMDLKGRTVRKIQLPEMPIYQILDWH